MSVHTTCICGAQKENGTIVLMDVQAILLSILYTRPDMRSLGEGAGTQTNTCAIRIMKFFGNGRQLLLAHATLISIVLG